MRGTVVLPDAAAGAPRVASPEGHGCPVDEGSDAMRTKGRAAVAAVVTAGLAAGAAATLAQEPVPEVTVELGARAATVAGADGLRPGVTTLVLGSADRRERTAAVIRLRPSVGAAELRRALRRSIRDPTDVRRFGTIVTDGGGRRGAAHRVTLTLDAGRYGIVDVTGRPTLRRVVTVAGEPRTTPAPAPAATFTLTDFRFAGPSEVAPGALVRWENRGRQFHHGVLLRLRSPGAAPRVIRQLRRGREPRSDLAGFAIGVGTIDRDVVNDVPAPTRAGTYVLACFLQDERVRRERPHVALGMVRELRVR